MSAGHVRPIHALNFDLEASPFELRLGDDRQLLDDVEVAWLEQDDGRAVVTALLQELPRLLDVTIQHVFEACRRNQRPGRKLPLEHGIGGNGGAVHEIADV